MNNTHTMTDHELVKLYEEGNDKAFDTLLSRYQDYIFSYIMFLTKNRSLAEDIFQDTFTRAIIAIRSHKYQATGKFSAWLMRIAHNTAIDRTRGQYAVTTSHDEFPDRILHNEHLCDTSLEKNLIEEQNRMIILQMLDFLPDAQREVVFLRFYEDLSFKEIAEKTGVSINTALGRMRYALINLRKIIGQRQLSLVG